MKRRDRTYFADLHDPKKQTRVQELERVGRELVMALEATGFRRELVKRARAIIDPGLSPAMIEAHGLDPKAEGCDDFVAGRPCNCCR